MRGDVATRELRAKVVSLRPDQADAVPCLPLSDVGDPATMGSHQLVRLGIRTAGAPAPATPPSGRRDRRARPMRRARSARQRRRAGAGSAPRARGRASSRARMTRAPTWASCSSQKPRASSLGLLGADRAQQRVALGEDAGHLDEVVRRAAVSLRDDAVEEATAFRRRADQEEHLLRPEEDGPGGLGDRRRAPRHAVDRQPLPDPRCRRAARHDQLDGRAAPRGPAGQLEDHPREARAVVHELGVHRGAMRAAGDRRVDRLEEVRLAGAVRRRDDGQARVGVELRPER